MTDKFDPYNELGVSPTAGTSEIKQAYKQRARETHPDTGGSPEEFEAVSKAYRLLTDQTKRERYDKTGSTEEQSDNTLPNAINKLGTLFVNVLMMPNLDAERVDIVRAVRNTLTTEIKKLHLDMNEAKYNIQKIERVQKRIVKRGGEMHDFVKETYNDLIRDAKRKIGHHEDEVKCLEKALDLLKDYECKPPEADGLPTGYLMSTRRFTAGGYT